MKPKVFISYSWTSQNHQNTIREWAEKLIDDGVEVLFDQFDLKEGNDKYAYMEKMITDQSVTHVLAFCDENINKKQIRVNLELELNRKSFRMKYIIKLINRKSFLLYARKTPMEKNIFQYSLKI